MVIDFHQYHHHALPALSSLSSWWSVYSVHTQHLFTIIARTSAASTTQINSDLEPQQLLQPVQPSISTLYDIRPPSHIHFFHHSLRCFLLFRPTTGLRGRGRHNGTPPSDLLNMESVLLSAHPTCNFRAEIRQFWTLVTPFNDSSIVDRSGVFAICLN